MSMMKYKNYAARVEYDQEDRIFVGRVAGIQDIVSFHGKTVDELEQAFHESVDHYLEVSERTGRPAQKPYSGNLMLRIAPELHAAVATVAQLQGKSINQWASEILSKAATR
ncbi:MAG: toxin-antitoxin system HicB family antitoxin [Proteobacteria bacterium]|nr:toxin-antitoxin system HicB family antitoxin [Pseudomonadota bacterium]